MFLEDGVKSEGRLTVQEKKTNLVLLFRDNLVTTLQIS